MSEHLQSAEGTEAAWVFLRGIQTGVALRDMKILVLSAGVKSQKENKLGNELSYRCSDKRKDKTKKLMKSEADVIISNGVAQIPIQRNNGLRVLSGHSNPSL